MHWCQCDMTALLRIYTFLDNNSSDEANHEIVCSVHPKRRALFFFVFVDNAKYQFSKGMSFSNPEKIVNINHINVFAFRN